ncbi:hypothetical protein AVEN_27773-1 [Araneus ventricosus]|uniref:Uncharacterized protein n=1 Tax=Araneus ventricosus TaxID=182803 RepID=A0A4Y2JEZ1_ARAVE|nr:hypothetical protein AVEN_27773-1 [Araneus ventricosus]
MENPRAFHTIPLHSPTITVCCGFISQFFEENDDSSHVKCSVTALRYRDMLGSFVLPQLQQRQCLTSNMFIQDGAPPNSGQCDQRFGRQHFTDDRVIICSILTLSQAHSPDLTPRDFWLRDHLKFVVYMENVETLDDVKDMCDRSLAISC